MFYPQDVYQLVQCGGSTSSSSGSDEEVEMRGGPQQPPSTREPSTRECTEASQASEQAEVVPRRHRRTIVAVVVLAALLVSGFIFHKQIEIWANEMLAVIAKLGWISVVILLFVNAALCVFMLPTFPMLIASSIEFTKLFGVGRGIVASLSSGFGGLWLGSIVSFLLGRTIWREEARKAKDGEGNSEFFRVINRMIDAEGTYIVFLARMSPLLPAEVFNYACAVTSISIYEFGIGCFGSLVPVTFWVVTTAQATHAADGSSKHKHVMQNVFFIAFNIVLLVTLTAMLYLSYYRFREAERAKEQAADGGTQDAKGPADATLSKLLLNV